jgi:predicted GH43/DUF377 family glycosyl hydrolase
MKWKKLGRIFQCDKQYLPDKCFAYAQSPQVIVFENFIRVYFSTREIDNNKFLSHVAFVDFSYDFFKIINHSKKEVIGINDLGCFDEHGIFPFNVLKHNNQIFAYTTGWNRKVSVSADASIGLAISNDGGETFNKFGKGPVMTASIYEPFLVCDAFVKFFNGKYHMWYIFGVKWITSNDGDNSERVYKIAYANSNDGINWERNSSQIIADVIGDDECQALPTVFFHKNRYHMYFCFRSSIDFRKNKENAYRIGYAYSNNLKDWIRADDKAGIDVSESGWDSEMQCYPHTFKLNDKIYLLYNGNEFGKYGFGIAELIN